MPKTQKTKTTMEDQGLTLALRITELFDYTKSNPIRLKQTSIASKVVQQYLDKHTKLISNNELKGIVVIRDTFKNATGGRVHLILGVSGPLADAFSERVLPQPIDYELKSRLFLRALASASGKKIANAGNIHVHVLNCYGKAYTPKDLIFFLKEEHGHQNEVLQLANFEMYYLDINANPPTWDFASTYTLKKLFA